MATSIGWWLESFTEANRFHRRHHDSSGVRPRKMERVGRAVRSIDPARYRRLLSRTMPVVIETEEENARMLAVVERLMKKGEDLSFEEEKLLKLLTRLV